jgi:hypothetical protein
MTPFTAPMTSYQSVFLPRWDHADGNASVGLRRPRCYRQKVTHIVWLALYILVIVPVINSGHSYASDLTPEVQSQIDELHASAMKLRSEANFDGLEVVRKRRWKLAEDLHKRNKRMSVWAKAYGALCDVDGCEDDTGKHRPGLIDQLRYADAYNLLLSIWKEVKTNPGPIPSEIAVRLFEVTQQALSNTTAVFIGESSAGERAFASRAELINALEEARTRDPCGTMATVMRSFLDKPTTSEVFLRAEVRPSLKKRQEMLGDLAHPALLVRDQGLTAASLGAPPSESTEDKDIFGRIRAAGNFKTERGDFPIQPWHAPVEWCRINSLSSVLEDLDYCRFLSPDQMGRDNKYVRPAEIIEVTDAAGNPAELLYGRLLIYRSVDSQQRNRTAVSYVNSDGVWFRKYVDVLVADSDQRKNTEARSSSLDTFLSLLPPAKSVDLGDVKVALKELPPGKSSKFLQQSVEVFCVRDAFALLDTQLSNTANEPLFLSRQEDSLASQTESRIYTTPVIRDAVKEFAALKDPTLNALYDLVVTRAHTPLVVVSLNDAMPAEPSWLEDGEVRYLSIRGGGRLVYIDPKAATEKRFEVDFGNGVRSIFPLNVTAVPHGILKQSPEIGPLYAMLADCGYKKGRADEELTKFLIDPFYFPKQALDRYAKRAEATGKTLQQVIQDALTKSGWDQPRNPRDILQSKLQLYGIRYLRDSYGNLVVHPGVLLDIADPIGTLNNSDRPLGDLADSGQAYAPPPFVMINSSGERIPSKQIYTFRDYQGVWWNRYGEHTRKILALHPCNATARLAEEQLASPLVSPSRRPPKWLSLDDGDSVKVGSEFSSGVKTLMQELSSDQFFNLTKCAAAGDADDFTEARISTLHNHLANLYRTCSHGRALIGRLEAERAVLAGAANAAGVAAILTEGKLGAYLERRFGEAVNRLQAVEQSLNEARSAYRDARHTVRATDWTAARTLAKAGRLHAATVRYNDLLEEVRTSQLNVTLLSGVATSGAADRFVSELLGFFGNELQNCSLEAELAGVLAASENKSAKQAACFLLSEIVAQQRLLLEPLIEACEAYMTAYGLRLTDEVRRTMKAYDELVTACETRLSTLDYQVDFRRRAAKKAADDEAIETEVAKFHANVAGSPAEPPTDRVLESFRGWLNKDISFHVWALVKKAALKSKHASAILDATFSGIALAPFVPKQYSKDKGFVADLPALFSDEMLGGCEAFIDASADIDTSTDSRFTDNQRMQCCVLLAWYWADRSQVPECRAALREAATAGYRAAIRNKDDVSQSLIDRRNAIACVAASFVGKQTPFAVSVVRSSALDAIPPLLVLVEREWFANGLDSAAISRDSLQLNADITQYGAVTTSSGEGLRRRLNRWFFCDYRYKHGCVPDSWWEHIEARLPAPAAAADGAAAAQPDPNEIKRLVNSLFSDFIYNMYDPDVLGLAVHH